MIHKMISFTVFFNITKHYSKFKQNNWQKCKIILFDFDRIHILVWIAQQTGAVTELMQYCYNSIQRLNNMNV
jgi:hypothetical protein